jgi:hypothetical protein
MEGLLFSGLSYIGNKIYTDDKNPNYLYNKNVYNSDIENQMNSVESNQAKTIKQTPEFFKQFDSLTFDNLSRPSGVNESYMTKNGLNRTLQTDLDFKNGYSEFQNTDMHYNVVSKENFVHNNMNPNTARRDTMVNLELNSRKFENLSGNNSTFFHKKEVDKFFDPNSFGSNVNGLPVVAGELTSRYITSHKNQNGNLPFKAQQRVLPGIAGKVSSPYAVTRVDPRSIDELRSDINKKTTYLSKPLETIKKGELRGIDPVLTAYKMPSYRNITTKDLVGNKHNVEGPRQIGECVHIDPVRGQSDINYMGGLHDSRQGEFYNSYTFTDSKKENFNNDFMHAINAVNSRPVFTNINSWCNYETDRGNNDSEVHASGAHNNNESTYYIDINNSAKSTLRENITYDNPSNISSTYQNGYTPIDDFAKQTIRETTNIDNPANIASSYQSLYTQIQDDLKTTIRETVKYDNPSNISSTYQNPYKPLNDYAKTTVRETTNYDDPSNISSTYQNPYKPLNDFAKTTVRETTNYDDPSNISSTYQNPYKPLNDYAKTTVRETTNYDDPSNISSTYQNPYKPLNDFAKTTVRETTNYDDPSNISSTYQNPYKPLNDYAKTTVRETINYADPSNMSSTYQNPYKPLSDTAKTTVRETTNYDDVANIAPTYQNPYNPLTDTAKTTIKETTNYDDLDYSNIAPIYQNPYIEQQDEVRNTIKQTLLHATPGGRMYNNEGTYKNIENARTTTKETTLITDYTGTASFDVNGPRIEHAERNMTIQDKRQQTALGGRISNPKSDQIRSDINHDTVRFQDKRTLLHGYVTPGNISTNYLGMNNCTNHKTNLNSNNFYRIDPIYVETLDNNPLVNDIRHPKNIDF